MKDKIVELKPIKTYEVFVSSLHNQRKWKIMVKAFGHTHAYSKAKSLHEVTVLSTRLLFDDRFIDKKSFSSYATHQNA